MLAAAVRAESNYAYNFTENQTIPAGISFSTSLTRMSISRDSELGHQWRIQCIYAYLAGSGGMAVLAVFRRRRG
jgi:hypothetical protein